MYTSFDIVAVIFAIISISPSLALSSGDEVDIDKQQLKQTFAKLLYELVDLNQQRLTAINRVLKLEELPVALRSSGEAEEVQHENPLIVYLINKKDRNQQDKNDLNNIYSSIIAQVSGKGVKDLSSTSKEDLDIVEPDADIDRIDDDEKAESADILRGWNSCKKSAVKECKKACKSASKNVCKDYKCSRRMKKAFKKECKSSCSDRFDK